MTWFPTGGFLQSASAMAIAHVGHLALAFGLVALAGTNWLVSAQTGGAIADPEAYAVYRAVAPTVSASGSLVDHVALLEETRFHECRAQGQTLAPGWDAVLADFRAQNATSHSYVPQMFDLGVPVELVPLDTVLAFLKTVGWAKDVLRGGWGDAFHSFPQGRLLAFSAVGFNGDKTLAMVTVASNCGASGEHRAEADCEQGETLVLRKNEGRWQSVTDAARPGCGWIV